MTQFEYLTPLPHSRLLRLADAARVAESLRGGGLAILPTETGYMVAALATSEPAVLTAFAVKQRDLANTMHVACASLAMAGVYGELTPASTRLLGEFTPGPLTVVVRQTDRLPRRLVTQGGTVGIRVPDHPATLQVIAAVGAPLTASSLNLAGEPSLGVDRETLAPLDWSGNESVCVVKDDLSVRYRDPSTLVRVIAVAPDGAAPDAAAEVTVLRRGPVPEEAIRQAIGEKVRS